MIATNPQIQLSATAGGASTPPPPPGFTPETSTTGTASATTPNIPPAPAGFAPDVSGDQVQSAPASSPGYIGQIAQPDGLAQKAERWADNVAYDIEHGTDLTGIGHVLKSMGAHGVYNGNSQAVGDFMASLPLGILKATKGAAELPQTGKHWQGTKDVAGGALQASTMPSAFVAPGGAEAAATGLDRAGDAIASGASSAGKALSAVKKPFSLKAVQEALQGSTDQIRQSLASELQHTQDQFHSVIRELFNQTANDAGVQAQPAESLRDIAANTAQAFKSKASGLYRQLDKALGGTRFQTFDEQLNNVRRALRNSAGIDPDQDGRLVERINDLEDAKAQAIEQAKAAGVNPKLVDQANSLWRQGSALEDLSKHVQASTSGLRGDLSQGVSAAQEAVSPTKLATRANRLYGTGRLQQALGEDRADDLLRAIEKTKQSQQDAATRAADATDKAKTLADQKSDVVKVRRYVAGSVLAGVPGFELLRHLLGN